MYPFQYNRVASGDYMLGFSAEADGYNNSNSYAYVPITITEGSDCTHEWTLTEELIPATCVQMGLGQYECSLCGATAQFSLPMLGHMIAELPAVSPTFFEPGLTGGTYCTVCGMTLQQPQQIPPLMDAADFVLPEQVETIEEEAFAGVSASVVILPEDVEHIGRRAFADCPNLRQIYIPADTTLDPTAFENVTGLTIFTTFNSPAAQYAAQTGCGLVTLPE